MVCCVNEHEKLETCMLQLNVKDYWKLESDSISGSGKKSILRVEDALGRRGGGFPVTLM